MLLLLSNALRWSAEMAPIEPRADLPATDARFSGPRINDCIRHEKVSHGPGKKMHSLGIGVVLCKEHSVLC